jgi:hypothetical protein
LRDEPVFLTQALGREDVRRVGVDEKPVGAQALEQMIVGGSILDAGVSAAIVTTRSIARQVALAATVLAAVWAIGVVLTGGFSISVGGRIFSSREPMRPILWGSLTLAAFVWANGAGRTATAWSRLIARLDHRVVGTGLAVVALAVGVGYSTTVGNASDAYGYVSESDLWLRGNLTVSQAWAADAPWPRAASTFAPLGYRPVETGTGADLVPVYSPGLPLLMAAAKRLGGQSAMFLVVPIAGAILVLATWGVGRRLGSSGAGLIAAWFVLGSPAFLFMLALPMSDVPVAACWAVTFYCLLRPGVAAGLGAGVAAGLGILIRPNLAWLAVAPGLWLLWQLRRRRGQPASTRTLRLLGFSIGASAAIVAVGFIFNRLYGSPFRSGYGDLGPLFAWSHVGVNARNYAGWLIQSQTPLVLAGFGSIAWPARLWPGANDRTVFWLIGAFVTALWTFYFFYLTFDAWWFLRFFLASWPFVMLGLAAVILALARTGPVGFVIATWLVVVLGVDTVKDGRGRGAFELWRVDRACVAAAQATRDMTPDASVVFAKLHSGSLRYYGGRMTLRFDALEGDWLDRAVAWMAEHGVSSYALLERREVPEFKARFPGAAVMSRLDGPPVLFLPESGLALYALTGPFTGDTRVVAVNPSILRSAAPVDLPPFAFR